MRDVEPDDVERGDRCGALEREQRHVRLAHGVGHVDPGQVTPLARDALHRVQTAVQNRDALVWQADVVHIGVDQAAPVIGLVLGEAPPLVVYVANGLLDAGEQRLQLSEPVFVGESHAPPLRLGGGDVRRVRRRIV